MPLSTDSGTQVVLGSPRSPAGTADESLSGHDDVPNGLAAVRRADALGAEGLDRVGARWCTGAMTSSGTRRRVAVDAPTTRRLLDDETGIDARYALVGPSVLRSHVLALLYGEHRQGALDAREARVRLDALAALKIRLLGDRVSRATAWRIALGQGWEDPVPAEYLAVATLQADVLVTDDPRLVTAAEGLVPLVPYADLAG